jgi:hypothetical protein
MYWTQVNETPAVQQDRNANISRINLGKPGIGGTDS